nr:adp-ribosylation factor gtpase-activating protein gcs1 [Quercus suber]
MDALKTNEVRRMELGGNKPWKDFFNEHKSNKLIGQDFDNCTIAERYDSEAGEEWKERLTCKVEGTEYVPGSKPTTTRNAPPAAGISSAAGSGRNTPLSKVSSSPQRTASPSQKARNEAYFAKMGSDNANRSEDLHPSQGGKYAGFGSSPMPASNSSGGFTDDFQKDPVGALTKGFGWLSSTVSKQAATVSKTYIQPGIKNLAEGDFAAQARAAAMQMGNTVQQGTKGLGDQFNKFVDPDQQTGGSSARTAGKAPEKQDFWDSFGQDPAGPPKEKKDFWDDFAAAGEQATVQKSKSTSIGTSAMKTGGGAGSGGKKEDGEWGDW